MRSTFSPRQEFQRVRFLSGVHVLLTKEKHKSVPPTLLHYQNNIHQTPKRQKHYKWLSLPLVPEKCFLNVATKVSFWENDLQKQQKGKIYL